MSPCVTETLRGRNPKRPLNLQKLKYLMCLKQQCSLRKGLGYGGWRQLVLACNWLNIPKMRAGLWEGLCGDCGSLVVIVGRRQSQRKAASTSAETVWPTPEVSGKVFPSYHCLPCVWLPYFLGFIIFPLISFPFPPLPLPFPVSILRSRIST